MNRLLFAISALAACQGAQAEAVNYAIDPTHTFAYFELTHLGISTLRVRLDRKQGSVRLDRAARTGKVDITIDMASVTSGVAAFDSELKGKDFFDVANHPSARFVADQLLFKGDLLTEVSGQLSIVGRTQALTLKARGFNCYLNPLFKREVCGGDFEATLMPSQWGLGRLPALAPDEVKLLVQVEAIKQQ